MKNFLCLLTMGVFVLLVQNASAQMPPMGNHSGMPPMGSHGGQPPMGSHGGQPPMGSHGGQPPMGDLGAQCAPTPNSGNDKKAYKREVKCLRQALHDSKPELSRGPGKDGLGAYGCGKRKTGSRTAKLACLRDLLFGACVHRLPGFPPVGNCNGGPGMPPGPGGPGTMN